MHKMVVLAKAAPGRKEELARWYDERHMKDLLSVEGFVSAERHDVIPVKSPADFPAWDFMLIYGFEGDPMASLRTMGGLLGSPQMPTNDALESVSTLSVVGMSHGLQKAGA